MVVFGDDEPACGGGGGSGEGADVDGLDGIAVDDACGDAVSGQLVGGGQAFVQGHPSADEGDLVVVAGAELLGPADRELLAGLVQDRVSAAGGAQVADPRC